MTRAEYVANCQDLFEFVLKCAFRCRERFPEEKLSETLCKHTLFPYVLRSSAAACREYPPEAQAFLRELDVDPERAAAEFRPVLVRLVSANFEGAMRPSASYVPGMSLCWSRPVDELEPNWCNFHIRNGISPKSFLNEPEYFAGNLLRIMEESEQKYPYDTLFTFTWLNSEPRFLRFFPEEWHRNLGEGHPALYTNVGFQGQFLNARGGLNRRNAEKFLETGELPYKPRRAYCSYAALREHLRKNFPGSRPWTNQELEDFVRNLPK